jgi:hypothetical protein
MTTSASPSPPPTEPNDRTFDEAIAALRANLCHARGDDEGSFSKLEDEFLELANDPRFLLASSVANAPQVESIVLATFRHVEPNLRVKGIPYPLLVMRYQQTDLYYGGFTTLAGNGGFLWFDDDRRGLVSIPDGGKHRMFVRLGGLKTAPGPTFPMRAPDGKN